MTANAHTNPRSVGVLLKLLARDAKILWLQLEALRAEVDREAKRTDRKSEARDEAGERET